MDKRTEKKLASVIRREWKKVWDQPGVARLIFPMRLVGESSNGRTTGSGPVDRGSTPRSPTKRRGVA